MNRPELSPRTLCTLPRELSSRRLGRSAAGFKLFRVVQIVNRERDHRQRIQSSQVTWSPKTVRLTASRRCSDSRVRGAGISGESLVALCARKQLFRGCSDVRELARSPGDAITLRHSRRHEQSLRAAASTQAWIERDDRRRFRIECGRKVQAIKGAHRHRERQDQPLGTTMNRRGQFGIAGRRMQFDPTIRGAAASSRVRRCSRVRRPSADAISVNARSETITHSKDRRQTKCLHHGGCGAGGPDITRSRRAPSTREGHQIRVLRDVPVTERGRAKANRPGCGRGCRQGATATV